MNQNKKKGFTLVELVIVIAVIAILAGVMIATFSNVVADAQASADMQELKTSIDATYYEAVADMGDLPNALVKTANSVSFAALPEKVLAWFESETSAKYDDKFTSLAAEPTADSANKGKVWYVVTVGESKEATTVAKKTVVEIPAKGEGGTPTYQIATETYVLKTEVTGKNGNTFIVTLITEDNYEALGVTEQNIGYYTFEAKEK